MGNKQRIQVFCLTVLFCVFFGCSPKADINPPSMPPLSRSVLGYGVIQASYTRILDNPDKDGIAMGYVRENTILTVLERKLIKAEDSLEYWVLTEGNYLGWVPESVIIIYDSYDKAQTSASQ